MEKKIKLSTVNEIKIIVMACTQLYEDISIIDAKGNEANAKSIIGLISLDYAEPVTLVCDNEEAIQQVVASYEAQTLADDSKRVLA